MYARNKLRLAPSRVHIKAPILTLVRPCYAVCSHRDHERRYAVEPSLCVGLAYRAVQTVVFSIGHIWVSFWQQTFGGQFIGVPPSEVEG